MLRIGPEESVRSPRTKAGVGSWGASALPDPVQLDKWTKTAGGEKEEPEIDLPSVAGSSIHYPPPPPAPTAPTVLPVRNSSHLEVFTITQPGSDRPINSVTLNQAGDDI